MSSQSATATWKIGMYFMDAISFLADPKIVLKNCLSLTALNKVFVGYGHLSFIIVTRSYKNCQVLFNKTKETTA
jgi:hypothetical protein